MKSISKLILYSFSIIFLSSCYPEWKLARSYIDADPGVSIMLLPTNYVFKENLKTQEAGITKGMSEGQRDSLLLAQSTFLKDISDSVFLETFINSMITELQELGYTVYTQASLDSFLFMQSDAYIFNIAQVLLEEHYVKHKDEEDFGDLTYHKTIDLNAVTYNFWFELSELNAEGEDTKLFFADETIHDAIDGYFTENLITGDVKYKYHINEIDTSIIYRYCEIYGERYAGYIYDYLMNQYIRGKWTSQQRPPYYMRFNRSNNTLDPTNEEQLIEMDQQ